MKKSSIALIGFMGTGKTTIGKKLAEIIDQGYQFVETDDLIEKKVKKSILEIFEQLGEKKFREYEIEICREISKEEKIIISCGGGIVLNTINIDYLKKNCCIILLTASEEVLYQRILKDGKSTRPLLKNMISIKDLREKLKKRQCFYEAAAEVTIDTTNMTPEEIATEILNYFQSAL